MKIKTIYNLLTVTEKLYDYLSGKIRFHKNGLPIFEKEMFLDEWPDLVIPYSQRKNRMVKNKNKTVLCFYDRDQYLYPRVAKAIDDIEEYKQYQGIVGMDLTITEDMDKEWQEFIFLINQLFLAVQAVNGVKIVINTRSAGLDPSKA